MNSPTELLLVYLLGALALTAVGYVYRCCSRRLRRQGELRKVLRQGWWARFENEFQEHIARCGEAEGQGPRGRREL